ncbi:MAG: heme ABC exporter ATP-binding protein CcmA [Acidimicrobiales bacterium]
MAAISLRSTVALAGRFPALAGVDLEVEPGEAVVLQGANGAGKTSVLRAVAGLLPATSGEISVLGRDVRRNPASARRLVGLLGHTPALYDDLSVFHNVRFSVRAAGGDQSTVPDALDRLGLAGRLARTPGSALSAGQRRRVALAVLVARRPPVWLLDEPTAALDAEGRELVDAVVGEALGSGATVLMASHDADHASALCDRVVTMAGGRVADARRGARRRVVSGGAHVA